VQPTVIIPTFWTRRKSRGSERSSTHFDHPTTVGDTALLQACLRSLEGVRGLGRVVIIVAAAGENTANSAEDSVRELLDDMPGIDSFVFGPAAMGSLHRRFEQLEFTIVLAPHNRGRLYQASLGACSLRISPIPRYMVRDRHECLILTLSNSTAILN